MHARQTIAELGSRFIMNNMTVLCHGYSRVVFTLLQRCVSKVPLPSPSTVTILSLDLHCQD